MFFFIFMLTAARKQLILLTELCFKVGLHDAVSVLYVLYKTTEALKGKLYLYWVLFKKR